MLVKACQMFPSRCQIQEAACAEKESELEKLFWRWWEMMAAVQASIMNSVLGINFSCKKETHFWLKESISPEWQSYCRV